MAVQFDLFTWLFSGTVGGSSLFFVLIFVALLILPLSGLSLKRGFMLVPTFLIAFTMMGIPIPYYALFFFNCFAFASVIRIDQYWDILQVQTQLAS